MLEILNQLKELSYNLHWSWNNGFYEIFEEINNDYWKWTNQNPIKFLNAINNDYLFEVIERRNLKDRIHTIYRDFRKYLNSKTYFENTYGKPTGPRIVYLSAEYGVAKCLKFYSGGLGTLSGDHMKSSSDLGIPLVGIGLAYLYGYFRQYINKEDRQAELYERNEFNSLPMQQLLDEDYRPVKIIVDMLGVNVYAQIWQVNVGRNKLYLLDSFVDENDLEFKTITDILYGGGTEKRLQQEILLGIGGMKLLEVLQLDIKAYHMNEGHSAFLVFERIKNFMSRHNISFRTAQEMCYYSNIFTTHTPVPAGIDIFHRSLMERYFKNYAEQELKVGFDQFFDEGDLTKSALVNDHFNMAYLAINNSNFVNGVSKLHGEIARKMWSLPPTRSQIQHITNGIHTKTYISPHSENLYIKNFGKEWYDVQDIWDKISELPDEDLWIMRNKNRKRLINFVRDRLVAKAKMFHVTEERIAELSEILDVNTLTIGFARRFATYKRGTLIFKDINRLKKIMSVPGRNIQFVFSGKAHPKDEEGKNLISEIIYYSNQDDFKGKIVFVENYDMSVAKYLVTGSDVWLNNPRKPLEASGTSGMKVVANGGLNLSISDGWWVEGYSEDVGWTIETPPNYESMKPEEIDWAEANSMYDLLEKEIIPLFYDRNGSNIPENWIMKMKASIRILAPFFNTQRMVKEYNDMFYMKVK